MRERTWVAVPGAKVWLGSPDEHLDRITPEQHYPRVWFEDELPQHRVVVEPFRIDRYPVTNAQFAEFVRETGYVTSVERAGFGLVYGADYWEETPGASWRHPAGPRDSVQERPDHPVVQVTHLDATAYASWAGVRLPTEAEWEYAAHGPEWTCWPWGDEWCPDRANNSEYWAKSPIADFAAWRTWWADHRERSGGAPATLPVGTFSPAGDSCFGVGELAGGVAEWTSSRYEMYSDDHDYDAMYRAASGRYTVVRGGGWMNFRYQIRTSERIACDPGYANFATGFRCASSDVPSGTAADDRGGHS